MTLRQRLILPLLILSLLLGGYLEFVWKPHARQEAAQSHLTSVALQLDAVVEGMIPLLLANQLDSIYENLAALKKKSTDWADVRLVHPSGRQMYPLAAAGTAAPAGENLQKIEKSIVYLDTRLGTLIVVLDMTAVVEKLRRQNNELALLLFAMLGLMFLTIVLTLEIAVRRPLFGLAEAARKLAAEDYDASLPKAGDDEVGTLVSGFSSMREEMRRRKRDLLAQHDKLLEQIGERKRADEARYESEERLRAIFDGVLDGIVVADAETGKFMTANPAMCRMLGYSLEEFARLGVSDIHPKQDLPRVREQFARTLRTEIVLAENIPVMRKDGSVFYADIKGALIRFGDKDGMLGVFRDITERKRAEEDLRAAEEQFRGLIEQSIAGIYIIQDGKFAYVNPRFAEIFGYDSEADMIGRDALSIVDEEQRVAAAESLRLWLEDSTATINYAFTALRKDGSKIEVGANRARATHRGRPAIIGLMQDISEKKRAEEQIQRYVLQLEKAFTSTVGVATTLSEMRDPYTAGHERRVAEIAVAIGAELGFDHRRKEGLRVAGYLHDVGKINIPSEILSKPGRLSAIEMELVRGHAQASYDVLKAVEFPWPVAQVALQHHERMDGSGYPQGLKGEAILLEARIMAVADVMEAMSSHRPYRPGLGIDKALAEIERGRGTAYDADAADACLRLFREKGYQLPG